MKDVLWGRHLGVACVAPKMKVMDGDDGRARGHVGTATAMGREPMVMRFGMEREGGGFGM